MNKKIWSALQWFFLAFLCFVVFSYWRYGHKENMTNPGNLNNPTRTSSHQNNPRVPLTVTNSSISPGYLQKLTVESPPPNIENIPRQGSRVRQGTSINPSVQPGVTAPGLAGKASVQANVQQKGNSGSNNQANTIITANPVLTDDQAMAGVNLANQQRQQREKILKDRRNQITQVHQAIMAEQAQNPTDSQVKPFVDPILTAPYDLLQKVKAHQVTVH